MRRRKAPPQVVQTGDVNNIVVLRLWVKNGRDIDIRTFLHNGDRMKIISELQQEPIIAGDFNQIRMADGNIGAQQIKYLVQDCLAPDAIRSEERRVGKEWRSRWW